MATQGIRLRLAPSELLGRLPLRPGVFLLDGGDERSWGDGTALLGGEPTTCATLFANGDVRTVADGRVSWSRENPFALIDRLLSTGADEEGDLPSGGLLCALGYDLGRWVECFSAAPVDDLGLAVMFVAVHPWLLAYSHRDGCYTLRSRQLDAAALSAVARRLESTEDGLPADESYRRHRRSGSLRSDFAKESYLQAVRRALDYIAAGDVYQVNLAQRFVTPPAGEPRALFARWLRQHPMPYSAYVQGEGWALVSNSPECFLRRHGQHLATLPIKGTRPRGVTPDQDEMLRSELLASPKERAEHVMIVDLERNDLGRVCEWGSVSAPVQPNVRSFPSIHHLESEVTGRLRDGTAWSEILRACFPGGSITGAPKIRAMEIIDELEPVARRFYTGSIGFIDCGNWARLNVAIRTAIVTDTSIAYHTGGGIVADSTPDLEYEETLLKARGFLAALGGEVPA